MTALHASSNYVAADAPLQSQDLGTDSSYILSIARLPGSYAACTSAPSNKIHLLDPSTIRPILSLSGHDSGTTSLRVVNAVANISKPSLVSSGLDGSIQVWDERTNTYSIKMTDLGQSTGILCCDVSEDGMTVVGGTQLQGDEAQIIYWDPRQPAAPLRRHTSTHSDNVTVLQYSPDTPNLLLSASTDGLISTSIATEDDEDEAVVHVGFWNCSVSQAGWIHSSTTTGVKIWGHSDMETFSTWSDEVPSQLAVLFILSDSLQLDLRQSQDIRDPSLHNHSQYEWHTDYLINCHSSKTSPDLKVFVGSNQGDFALLSNGDLSQPGAPWRLMNSWSNGHSDVVRSLYWDEKNSVIITGGEDSKINLWNAPSSFDSAGLDDAMEVDSPPPDSRKRDRENDDSHGGKRARR
ncbi:WD40 repeat-like protein [Mycena indigotica]|uniref:WD40 repeat-like protein n=1 Tax=Mycena indigotica TaxID=2126181 RepID=A0A8H6SL21_9AGAR|nr:WD40 repeat-like protein [Mycena indigotica]KAF7301573.1 WD40 repeat-like protein [Mycena indigotica]